MSSFKTVIPFKAGVYVCKLFENNLFNDMYKIGKSNNIFLRFCSLNTSVPINFELIYVIIPENNTQYFGGVLLYIERKIHKILSKFRYSKGKEFFILSDLKKQLDCAVNKFNENYNFKIIKSSKTNFC